MKTKPTGWLLCFMILGYSFLYLPILSLIAYSFNDSRVGASWSGFSLKWYEALLHNNQLLSATWVSFKVAIMSASLSVILGTLAAAAMVRLGKFKGRTLFGLLTAAPLVMPEVITGLAMLLLFIGLRHLIGWPQGRGISTITIAHTTFCMSYVTLLVRSRLSEMDNSLEEAALDLGAKPSKVFLTITLPIISPALLSGWLLAFALSLDDLVIASFTSGPASSTLPMVIFANIRFNLTPQINALATLIITIVAISVAIAGYLMHRRN